MQDESRITWQYTTEEKSLVLKQFLKKYKAICTLRCFYALTAAQSFNSKTQFCTKLSWL